MLAARTAHRLVLMALTCLAASTQAQFVRPPTDLQEKMGAAGMRVRFKEVPAGICETRSNIKSFSGFADIGPSQHVYFQFFEARKGDPKMAPLSIWLEGGTGGSATSSLEGLFQGPGPCRVGADGKLTDNPHAWTEAGSNLLFIDEPVSIGFSYTEPVPGYTGNHGILSTLPSESCPDYAQGRSCGTHSFPNISLVPRTTAEAASQFYSALQGFVGAFPEYSMGGVNLASRENGGHFLPLYAKTILDKNKEAKPDYKYIDLKSIILGDALISPSLYFKSQRDFAIKNPYGIAVYPNASVLAQVNNALDDNCIELLKSCDSSSDGPACFGAHLLCVVTVHAAFTKHTGRDISDARQLFPVPFPSKFHRRYLNTAVVQSALGVFTNYTFMSTLVDSALSLGGDYMRELQSSETIRQLVDAGVTVALYAGDADATSLVHNAVWDKIAVPGHAEAGFTNLTTSDGRIHGQVRQAGLLSYTRFYLSGSPVAFYKPLASLEFFERAINGKDIATGTQVVQQGSTYKTIGRATTDTFHGNATVQYKRLPPGTTLNLDTGMPQSPASLAANVKLTSKED